MSDDWCETTKEKIAARRNFITELFFKWREKICSDLGRQDSRFLNNQGSIIWRIDAVGTEYNPQKICMLYFGKYRREAGFLMKDAAELLDRHKIVALTQRLIVECCPITYSWVKPFEIGKDDVPRAVRFLNASFAFYFALEFLGTWNKELYEKEIGKSFDADRLFECLNIGNFAAEHRKFLMLELESPFPTVLMAHLWYAVEQWGLARLSTVPPPH